MTQAELQTGLVAESRLQFLVREIATLVRRSNGIFPSYTPRTAAASALSLLRAERLSAAQLPELLDHLARLDALKGFLRMAHPKRSVELRDWLAQMGVPWSRIAANYEWELEDSLDIFFGVVAGVLQSQYEDIKGLILLPATVGPLLPKLAALMNPSRWLILNLVGLDAAGRKILDRNFAQAPQAYMQAVLGDFSPALVASGLIDAAGLEAQQWQKELDELIGKFEFFRAGQHIGKALGLVLGLLEAGIGLAKFAPKLASAGVRLASELGARLSKAIREGPQALQALRKEIIALNALDHIPLLKAGDRLPAGFSKQELLEALEKGYLEMPDGRKALLQPCGL